MLGVMAEAVAAPSQSDRLTQVLTGLTRWLNLRLARGGWVRLRRGAPAPEVLAGLEVGDLRKPEQQALAVYDADYTAIQDPALTVVLSRLNGDGITVRRQDVISDDEWYASEFVTRIVRPTGLDGTMYSAVPVNAASPDGSGEYFAMTLVRAWGAPVFSEEERDGLSLVHRRLTPTFQGWTREQTGRRALGELPPRLRQTLACLLDGDSEKQAAQRMELSPHTVHQYVKRLHRLLRVKSRGELLAHCRTLGVMPDSLREMKGEVRRLPI